MRWALLLVIATGWTILVLLSGCAPARTAREAEQCRNQADQNADREAVAWCPPGRFIDCPEYPRIMAQWRDEIEACR